MKLKPILLVFIISLWHAPLYAQQPMKTEKKLSDLTNFYTSQAEKHHVVGSALAMIRNGDPIFHTTYGLARREGKQPVDKQSIFHWASITKTFTGIAIMQLRDRGQLSLDDPVTKYIPELQEVHNEYGSMDDITIRHLMSHSSGFRNPTWPWDDANKQRWMPHEPQDWEQLVAMFPYTEIKFEPGSQWSYSNPGIIFLGIIIERLTKDDYEYYVQKNILNPLNMYNSYFDKTPYRLRNDLVQSYYLQDDSSYEKARFDLNTGITVSNGGLSAPLPDMVKYLNFLLGNADEAAYEYVLSRSSINEMFQPQIAIAPEADGRENIIARQMGLTFFVSSAYNTHLISHSGGQNGFISHIYLAPDKNMAYVVAYNTTGKSRELDRKLMQYITKNIFAEVPDVK
ncbi:MAG: beta-lactamase family protein [Balneolaceae bacterium]|nr:beta-lactamase family protein [Balneolaceae bacterium]